jgi:phage terminase large subunit-like protein
MSKYSYHEYAEDVRSGRILVCRAVRKAVDRWYKDFERIERDPDCPFVFSEKEAQRIINFTRLTRLRTGELFEPESWQQWLLAAMYGFRRKSDGFRRFEKAYIQIAKKNGKTQLGTVLEMFDLVTEPKAEVYGIATDKLIADRPFKDAKELVESSPELQEIISTRFNEISCPRTGGIFRALSSEDNKNGLGASFVLADEYAFHKSNAVFASLTSGMVHRDQPLVVIITTAGFDKTKACYQEYGRCKKILDEIYEDDLTFVAIYELDEGDDYRDPACWIKANPNLGVSVKERQIAKFLEEAEQNPANKTEFLTYHMNTWVDAKSAWIAAEAWTRCRESFDLEPLRRRECFAGIDLSAVSDLTCFTLYFPPASAGEKIKALHRVFIPEETIAARAKHEHIMIRKWIEQGYVTATPGGVVDHQYLVRDFLECAELYRIQEVGYDPALSAQIVAPLDQEGFIMIEIRQGLQQFSPLTKLWEMDVRRGNIADPNPVMQWCVSNAVIKPDVNKNYKPLREHRENKIDLVVTSIMAHSRMIENAGAGVGISVYSALDEEDPEEPDEPETEPAADSTIQDDRRGRWYSIYDLL